MALELGKHGVRQRLTRGVVALGAEVIVRLLKRHASRSGDCVECFEALCDNFIADAVAGDHCEFHMLRHDASLRLPSHYSGRYVSHGKTGGADSTPPDAAVSKWWLKRPTVP